MAARGWRAVVALLLCALVTAGCSQEETSPVGAQEPPESPSETPGETPPSSRGGGDREVPVADPDHAVEMPGPLKDRLYRPDMLIFDQHPLSDATVERIRDLPQVAAAEVIGLGNVAIENQALTVAAVDGATYRRFTPYGTAQTQDVWDRVAGGELAINPRLGKRLQDDDGNLALGTGEDAPVVHIGAYAQQPVQVDMVVNTAWVEDIDQMVFGNGLLISTEGFDPSTIRKDVQRIVGGTASVQDLGSASTPTSGRPRSSPVARSPTSSAPSATACWAAAGSHRTRPGSARTSPPRRSRSSAASPATARSSRS